MDFFQTVVAGHQRLFLATAFNALKTLIITLSCFGIVYSDGVDASENEMKGAATNTAQEQSRLEKEHAKNDPERHLWADDGEQAHLTIDDDLEFDSTRGAQDDDGNSSPDILFSKTKETKPALEEKGETLNKENAASRARKAGRSGINDVESQEEIDVPGESSSANEACTQLLCLEKGDLSFWPLARLRFVGQYNTQTEGVATSGLTNGASIDQARLGMGFDYRGIVAGRIVFEGASLVAGAAALEESRNVILLDAWLDLKVHQAFQLRAGQHFAPGVRESMESRAQMVFVDRAVGLTPLRSERYFQVDGLAHGRDLGLTLGVDRLDLWKGLHIGYLFGAFNGNGIALGRNDNNLPMLAGRVQLGFRDVVTLGGGARVNARTVGTLPARFNERVQSYFGDLLLSFDGFALEGQMLRRDTYLDSVFLGFDHEAKTNSQNVWMAKIHQRKSFSFDPIGLRGGYRFALFNMGERRDDKSLIEHSAALRYDFKSFRLPLALIAEYSYLLERDSSHLALRDNHQFRLLIQGELP